MWRRAEWPQAGFQAGWLKMLGNKQWLGAMAGAKVKDFLTINVGLFSGVFDINLDNFGTAKVFILNFEYIFLEAKVAFTAGASYVNRAAGNLLAGAQATLGSLVRNVRKLGGRVIGYIVKFHEKLMAIMDKMGQYIQTGQKFVSVAQQFNSIGDAVKTLAIKGLRKLESMALKLLQKCVRVGVPWSQCPPSV